MKLLSLICALWLLIPTVSTAAEPAVIAVILPLTGNTAPVGKKMQQAMSLALKTRSQHAEKSRLQFQFFDNFSDPDSSRNLAKRLCADPKVLAILGGFPSDCGREIATIAGQDHVPHLIVSASADSLTINSTDFIFRLSPPTSEYNDGLIGWAANIVGERRNLALVYERPPRFSEAVNDFIQDMRQRWRGPVARHAFTAGEQDFTTLIKSIEQDKPALVWILGTKADAARFIRQCRELDWSPSAFAVGTVGQVANRLISLSENAADYVFAPAIWWHTLTDPQNEHFVDQYRREYQEIPDYHTAEAFAAINVVQDAGARSVALDRKMFRSALEETDLMTVVGRVRFETFSGFERQNRMRTFALQHQNGTWVIVWPSEQASGKYIYPPPDWLERNRFVIDQQLPIWYFFVFVGLVGLLLFVLRWYRSNRQQEIED